MESNHESITQTKKLAKNGIIKDSNTAINYLLLIGKILSELSLNFNPPLERSPTKLAAGFCLMPARLTEERLEGDPTFSKRIKTTIQKL